jgi:hypothetical protein
VFADALAQPVPSGPQWVHEINGFRFICRRDGEPVRGIKMPR